LSENLCREKVRGKNVAVAMVVVSGMGARERESTKPTLKTFRDLFSRNEKTRYKKTTEK